MVGGTSRLHEFSMDMEKTEQNQQPMTPEERAGAEATLRRALVRDIKRWEGLVREANEICRSAHEIASRQGADTNWKAFTERLSVVLKNQHAALHPKPEPDLH